MIIGDSDESMGDVVQSNGCSMRQTLYQFSQLVSIYLHPQSIILRDSENSSCLIEFNGDDPLDEQDKGIREC